MYGKQKSIVIFGAGSIGRGFLGWIFGRSGWNVARKLGNEDRVVGALSLCLKHGYPIEGLAEVYLAGLKFAAYRGEEVGAKTPVIEGGIVADAVGISDKINGTKLDPRIRRALMEANS